MLKGFKEFISQGNALELAVAVIIGAAFKPIVDAITKVILDIIGQVVGGNDLARADRARDDERLLARLRSGAKHAESQGRSGAEAQGDHEMTVPP